MIDPTEQFRIAILAAGLTPPDEIVADGRLQRFSTNGKPKDDSGWYMLHLDGIPAGAFGCWRSGLKSNWCAKADNDMTVAEREAHRQRIKAMQAQREAEHAQVQQQASEAAALIWKAATPATGHEYLTRKGIYPYGVKCDGHHLLIPMRDTLGKLQSLQTIAPDGGKRFQPGGRVKGCYFAIGKPDGVLIVCEGYATGASIHEATGHAVAVAFNAGNLRTVAESLRAKHPALKIILAADDDADTLGNPGLTKATEAARTVGGYLARPDFGSNRPDGATDFNDLHQTIGADAVCACIEAATCVDAVLMLPELLDADSAAPWPDPIPLPDALPAVQAFDTELLPEALRGWVADIADRMQCPPDFTAVGAVVALSSLVGARAVVSPKARDDWRVVPNLWGLIVGRPGVMKSPALSEVLKPLHRLESSEREQWKAAHEAWQLDCKVAEMASEANAKQARCLAAKEPSKARALLAPVDTPAEPLARRYVVNDATVEKLGELLTVNQWGLLVYRDELHGLLCSMDRQGQEGARGFYLTGYDGNQGHAVDRIGRGESYISRVCLAMLGGIQPGKLQSYVREPAGPGPLPEPRPEKLVIKLADGKARQIQHMSVTTFWGPDGKPLSPAQFLESLFGALPEFFKSEDELRAIWADPTTRKGLLDALAEKGFGREPLAEMQRVIDAEKSDLFDVLAYVAFALPTHTRAERAANAKAKAAGTYGFKQQAFIDFVLGQYVDQGVDELSPEKLTPLLRLRYNNALADAAADLGPPDQIRSTFVGFQRLLYQQGGASPAT